MRRVLILGGTSEARRLAAKLDARGDLDLTLSLAGRTASPAPQPVPVRRGGFDGVKGLVDYLIAQRVDILIDATHPYAAIMSANAARAAEEAGRLLLALRRPPWIPTARDRWLELPDIAGVVRALGQEPRRVFLALGRKELEPFAGAPQHFYLVRSVDPVDPPLPVPRASYLTARGPFHEADERALLERHRIDVIVAKNSGGSASYPKLAAARALNVPVILLQRPPLPQVPAVETVEEACTWVAHALRVSAVRGV